MEVNFRHDGINSRFSVTVFDIPGYWVSAEVGMDNSISLNSSAFWADGQEGYEKCERLANELAEVMSVARYTDATGFSCQPFDVFDVDGEIIVRLVAFDEEFDVVLEDLKAGNFSFR